MEVNFGIHQDVWQDAWIAATSAVRARKRQIDLNVQERVRRLLSDFGPQTGKALSLRVYGTMIKGFCVINNDRAKVLHSDCERMVLLFAQQPYLDQALKLPAGKRQRVDALTLDLTRVKEAEAFDWTSGAPMEMLTLEVERLPEPDSSEWVAMPSLALDEAAASLLVTNSFPEQPMPAPMPAQPAQPAQVEAQDGQMPQGEVAVDLHAVPPGSALELAEPELKRTPKRRLRRLPMPGHVLGMDLNTELTEAHVEVISARKMLTTYAEELSECLEMSADHVGPLRWMLDPPDDGARGDAGPGGDVSRGLDTAGVVSEWPEVQPLLSDEMRPEMLGAIFAEAPEADAYLAAAAQAAEAEAMAMASEIVEAAEIGAKDEQFDAQTAQVGAVIRRFVESNDGDGPMLLENLIPPSCTGKDTAARTFACLLSLATGGGLQVQQDVPYGPISIALAA